MPPNDTPAQAPGRPVFGTTLVDCLGFVCLHTHFARRPYNPGARASDILLAPSQYVAFVLVRGMDELHGNTRRYGEVHARKGKR
ncbi:hypothetical protein BV25DRAFT_1821131 [Artomyces pyxidatus]|uniref:Uncharacterized protein n=1 Tax=Artomyces pyxidatus TaxID=48021 RepID=A0ACB8TCR5_9AGAM|nr:hypothetical protein BV25DRAFT_1821131 [Artomyces pyxidatus]